ncbi:MAG: hypothetical protein GY913_17230 [Proteobacteria bacterium]|nr:hypothetical protein [Pseudomonadota bacterium]MCP4918649.1 hypothetical protein [Pseudomonadota bacterium]
MWSPEVSIHAPTNNLALSELVAAYVDGGANAQELYDSVVRHVRHVTRRYPDAYFELGQRTDDALDGLAGRVFTICAQMSKGRFPFMGRPPFRTYVEEQFDDAPIRYHSFYAKLSITRELLRDDYAKNIRRDPVLRFRDELHRKVGRVLKEHATPVEGGQGGHRRWTCVAKTLQIPASKDQVVDELRARRDEPLDALVPYALRRLALPISHSRLSNLLGEVLDPPSTLDPSAKAAESLEELVTIRNAVLSAWSELSTEERALVAALARGDSYDDLIARCPELNNRVAVSRAVKRVGARFVGQVVTAVGGEADAVPPRELLEHVVGVLVPMLPELQPSTQDLS